MHTKNNLDKQKECKLRLIDAYNNQKIKITIKGRTQQQQRHEC